MEWNAHLTKLNGGLATNSYVYDANGNMTIDGSEQCDDRIQYAEPAVNGK